MKNSLLTLGMLGQSATAHYVFNRLILPSTGPSHEFQYIRDVAQNPGTSPPIFAKSVPVYGLDNPALICGRNATYGHSGIQTAVLKAGESLGWWIEEPWEVGEPQRTIFHPGPGQAFLSYPPLPLSASDDEMTNLAATATTKWFKVAYAGVKDSKTWALLNTPGMNFSIPVKTAPGRYLMRIEQWMPHPNLGESQWYVNCAQVEIRGSGGGVEPRKENLISFPNAYDANDPGIRFSDGGGAFPEDLTTYVPPKPEVWTGEK